ncbi:Uncharacterized protein Fot_29374 [Forsythia ovata]|uniref:Uncharacterized protein n=1 Tax=Forsythia ovata TaxID=205694 RepID=A0ABD1TS77_9LAMI
MKGYIQELNMIRLYVKNVRIKKHHSLESLILKLVVSDGIDEAHVTLFDASDYLIGCTLSEYAEDMKKTDKKTEPDRVRKYIIVQEIKKYELLEVSNVQNEDDGPKQAEIENQERCIYPLAGSSKPKEEEVKRLPGGKIKNKR